MGRREQIGRRGPLLYGGLIVAGLALGVLGLPAPLAVLGAAAVINGVALELCSLAWLSALQQLIPRHQLGRVSSASEFGSYALLPLGYGVAGWATEQIGAPPDVLLAALRSLPHTDDFQRLSSSIKSAGG